MVRSGAGATWQRVAAWRGWARVRVPLAVACLVGGGVAFGLPVWSGWWTGHVQAGKSRLFRQELQQSAPATPGAAATAVAATSTSFAALPPPPAPGASALAPAVAAVAAPKASALLQAEALAAGDPLAEMTIPSIGVQTTVLEGLTYNPAVWTDLLRDGPSHVLGSPLPGQPGNMVIFGHLNIWGAVFLHLSQVRPGDTISFETTYGQFQYRVTGSQSIAETDLAAVAVHRAGPATVQLVTCEGVLDAQRLVVDASLLPAAGGHA